MHLEELFKGKPEGKVRSEVPQLKRNIQVTRNIGVEDIKSQRKSR